MQNLLSGLPQEDFFRYSGMKMNFLFVFFELGQAGSSELASTLVTGSIFKEIM